jgi:hypothetical protein
MIAPRLNPANFEGHPQLRRIERCAKLPTPPLYFSPKGLRLRRYRVGGYQLIFDGELRRLLSVRSKGRRI